MSAFITPPTTRLKQPRWSDKHNVYLMLVHLLRRWPNIYNVACVCLGLAYWFAWSIPYRVNITFMENHAFSSVQHYILGGWSKPLLKNTRPTRNSLSVRIFETGIAIHCWRYTCLRQLLKIATCSEKHVWSIESVSHTSVQSQMTAYLLSYSELRRYCLFGLAQCLLDYMYVLPWSTYMYIYEHTVSRW